MIVRTRGVTKGGSGVGERFEGTGLVPGVEDMRGGSVRLAFSTIYYIR